MTIYFLVREEIIQNEPTHIFSRVKIPERSFLFFLTAEGGQPQARHRKAFPCAYRRRGETVAVDGFPGISKLSNPLGGLSSFSRRGTVDSEKIEAFGLRLMIVNYDKTIMPALKKSRTNKISKNFTTVTNKLLKLIEGGTVPWHQSWHDIGYQNLISKKPYSGINPILCQIDCLYYGYSSPYYIGKAQCSEKEWRIKQGSKANWLRWGGRKTITEQVTDEQGQTIEREKFIRSFKWLMVFNIEAIDDSQSETKVANLLPYQAQESRNTKDLTIESFIANLNTDIKYGGNKASHNFTTGQIQMPYCGQFVSRDGFWATLFHELVHSTAKELKRSYSGDKDHPTYHREELVADLGASFLGNHFGLGSTELEHHATYLEHYWSLLNSDIKVFFHAVYEAQNAVQYLLKIGGV